MSDFLDQFENIDLEIHGIRLPKFKLSENDADELGVPHDINNKDLFKQLVNKGFQDKLESGEIPKESCQDYKERLDYEVGVVEPSDFVDYFLEIWEDINIARKNGIPIGPGRGCLIGDSLIQLKDGLKELKDVQVGDLVVNKNGQLDRIINKFEYDSVEDLIEFDISAGTNKLRPKMTQDHKVLVLKNPFNVKEGRDVKGFRSFNLNEYLNIENACWVYANQVEKRDYLVRYVGRTEPEKDIEFIDLAQFTEKYDDQFIYVSRRNSYKHFLCTNVVSKATGVSKYYVERIQRGKEPVNTENSQKVVKYLIDNKVSLEDFKKYKTKENIKIKRFLPLDEEFCYILGFFIGDGYGLDRHLIFCLNSEIDKEREVRITKYFTSLGLVCNPMKSKEQKAISLYVYSTVFSKLFSSLVQNGCLNKSVPDHFLNLPDEKLKSLLNGLIDSDGHKYKNGKISFVTTSFKLAVQTRKLFEYFGHTCPITIKDHCSWKRGYYLLSKISKEKSSFNNGKYVFIEIKGKNIVKNVDNKVYDISVKTDPSYHTLDFIVHNSAPGSLILYVLGITKIDSVKHGLYFERFLSESRLAPNIVNGEKFYGEAVDVDTDISDDKRHILVDLLKEKHKGHFCKISTVGTLQSRKCIKEVCKIVLGYSEQQSLEISSMVPSLFGKIYPLKKAVAEVSAFSKFSTENEKAFKIALKLSELPFSKGSHASAYIISHDPLIESVPCEMGKDEMVTSYDMNYVMMYNIKLDLLGLKAVGIIDDVCQNLGIEESDFILDYENVYSHLQDVKHPYGLFQVSGSCNLGVVNSVKPKNIDHLAGVVALARPGALEFVDRYSKFVNEGECESVHPFFDEVLKPTAGLALYQESAIKMCEKLGLSKVEGESVRRGISKKKIKEIKKWEEVIFRKAKEQKLDPEVPKVLWRILEASAAYSFNRSHSYSYGTLAAETVYLKFKYPQHFFLACLRQAASRGDFIEHFEQIQHELPYFGIQLLPPNIAKSGLEFSIEGKDIRFGIGEIKGISEKSIAKLQEFTSSRGDSDFDIFNAAQQSKLGIGKLSALIQSGALGHNVAQRSKKVLDAQVWNILTPKEKNYCLINESKYNGDVIEALRDFLNWTDSNGKKFTKESRLNTLRRDAARYFQIYNLNHVNELLASYFYEKTLLGFSYSTTLKMIFGDHNEDIRNIKEIEEFVAVKDRYELMATVKEVIEGKSKNGNNYIKLRLADETGETFAMILGDSLARYLDTLTTIPKEDDILLVKGAKGENILWINKMEIQNVKVYTKLSDLKNLEKEENNV